jgi:ribosomal protein S27AE
MLDNRRTRMASEENSGARPGEQTPASPDPSKNVEPALLFCPVCSTRLESHRCKLICSKCGYFMSCADYY